MRLVCIGDTHREEHNVKFPEGDILIHSGDYDIYNESQLKYLNKWFGSLNFKHIICCGGNHDFFMEKCFRGYVQSFLTNVTYLEHESVEIEGLKFFASPYTPRFGNWAFMYERKSEHAQQLWDKISENLDFLITHGPAYQILDQNRAKKHCGCEVLHREVFKKKPKYHVFGHIHRKDESFPKHIEIEGINFYNVAVLDEDYKLSFEPTIIEIGEK